MPHTQGAKKALRQNTKRRVHNRRTKKDCKLQIREFVYMVDQGTKDESQEEYNYAAQRLDKMAARNIIHPNKAARKKSQLAKLLAKKLAGDDKPAGEADGEAGD